MKNYKTIKSLEQFKECINYIKSKQFISYDIETNSNVEKTTKVIGIGVTGEINEGWYFPIRHFDLADETLKYIDFITDSDHELELVNTFHAALKGKKLIMHNGVFDIACIYHSYDIDLTEDLFADTIMMKHTVDEERPFGLKDLAKKWQHHLGIPAEDVANEEQLELKESIKDNGGSASKKNYELYKASLDIIAKYCCADVDLTIRLFDYLDDRIESEGLSDFFYNKEVMPLYKKCTIPMKLNGLYCDIEYFERLKSEVEDGIEQLKNDIFKDIDEAIQPFVEELLDDSVRPSKTGKFAEAVFMHYDLPVPRGKNGNLSFAKTVLKPIETTNPDHPAIKWLHGEAELPKHVKLAIQKRIFREKEPEHPNVFNLQSKAHLIWLLFTCYKLKPLSYTYKTQVPQLTKETLPTYKDAFPWISKLMEFNKEVKLLSTYILPIIKGHVNGWVYPSMLQWGTTSGRYSCGGENSVLNLQTLPRDDKRIKKGFIAPPGYKIVAADFSSLEPRVFAWVSGDIGLKTVYWDNLDLYAKIAIDVFDLHQYSAKEEDANFLKKVAPEKRQLSKTFTLAVPYGAGAGRIAGLLGVEYMEAQQIIDKYLDAYPQLKDWMEKQYQDIIKDGFVTTQFGRVRHQLEAKTMFQKYGKKLEDKKEMAMLFGGFKGKTIYKGYTELKKDIDAYNKMIASDKYNSNFAEIQFKIKDTESKISKLESQYKDNLESENKMILKLGAEGVTEYYKFRNFVNNSRNFPIQATAAHIANASMIKLSSTIKDIDAKIILQIHDEIVMYVKDTDTDKAMILLQDAMEHNPVTAEIDIPITAEPIVAKNLAEAK